MRATATILQISKSGFAERVPAVEELKEVRAQRSEVRERGASSTERGTSKWTANTLSYRRSSTTTQDQYRHTPMNDYEELQNMKLREYQTLQITHRPDGLDILTLARPPMNPMSKAMFLELAHYFSRLRTDFSVRVVILRAEGKAFSAGLDLKQQGTAREETNASDEAVIGNIKQQGEPGVLAGQRRVSDLPKYMRACPQPIICCVQGSAAGGGFGLALASDVRLATPEARFNVAMIRIGLSGLDVGIRY